MKTKLLLIFILSTFLSIGQSGQISGIVTDEDGKLLPFTTIYIKNIETLEN